MMSLSGILRTLVRRHESVQTMLKSSSRMLPKNTVYVNRVNFQLLARSLHGSPIYNSKTYYTTSHEWIEVEGEKGTIGITDYAQDKLGDIVYCDISDPDQKLEQNDVFATVESVKAASDLYMPVTAEILESNTKLEDNPKIINDSPTKDGWIVKIKLEDLSQLEGLLNESAYDDMVKMEQGEN